MNSGLKSLLIIVLCIVLAGIIIPIIFSLLPYVLLALAILYFYTKYKTKNVKWYDGTMSDNYYQKVENKDVIDVEVKARAEKHE